MGRMANRWRRVLAGGLLVGLCSALPGCELWNNWLEFLKWKPALQNQNPPPRPAASPPIMASGAGASVGTGVAMVPRVTVFRITVPVGAFSGNERIWSQLNEDAMDSKTSVLMAQNGLRAATGLVARWPGIAAILDGPGATTDQTIMQTDGRSSINVVTRQNVTDQIVVSIDRDLQEQGRTFERCDNGFRLSMRGVKNKPELTVQLEPVVTLGTVQVMRTGAEMGMRGGAFTSEESFEDLRMAATLRVDQFLVLSCMDPKSSPFSVGTLWLSDRDKVPATETVLVFVPAAVSTAAK